MIQYYKEAHKIKINDESQPLLLVKTKGNQDNNLYFIPELCSLSGLDDDAVKDRMFMTKLAELTKLEPDERVRKTNEFLKLFSDPEKKEEKKEEEKKDEKSEKKKNREKKDEKNDWKNKEILSAKEKSELYGIEIKPVDKLFTAYYMKDTNLLGGGNKSIKSNDRTFPVKKAIDMTKWLCFYEKSNYNEAEKLYNNLSKASKAF